MHFSMYIVFFIASNVWKKTMKTKIHAKFSPFVKISQTYAWKTVLDFANSLKKYTFFRENGYDHGRTLWSGVCGGYELTHSPTPPPGQNGRHFADDIFKCIFLNENLCILIQISLKFVSKGPIDNKWALVQVMAWRRTATSAVHTFHHAWSPCMTISGYGFLHVWLLSPRAPIYRHGLTLIPAWISNHIHYEVCDEITYPFPNIHECTVEVWEWISNFTPHCTGYGIMHPCWDQI